MTDVLDGRRVFDLEQPRWHGAPIHPSHVPPGFSYVLHRRHEPQSAQPDGRTGSSGTIVTSDHTGTHIDALTHQAVGLQLCGGIDARSTATSFGYTELGVDTISPIATRGLLIDLGDVEPDRWISLAEVRRAAEAQGVRPGPGDVVLVRTGNGAHWNDPVRYLRGSGMLGEVSQWLADAGVIAVGADNMAWDFTDGTDPELGITLPGHVILLVRSGVYIIENLFLEELAAAGVHEFTFICTPLKIRGATGSPVRPIALAWLPTWPGPAFPSSRAMPTSTPAPWGRSRWPATAPWPRGRSRRWRAAAPASTSGPAPSWASACADGWASCSGCRSSTCC